MKKYLFVIIFAVMMLPKTVMAIADGAQSACVVDAVTGKIVFEKNADERLPMASTTKIMTAIIALEMSSPKEVVEISKNAEMQEGSSAYVRAGDRMYMSDLIYGLMLNSGNDAAVAIAEHIAGSSEAFAELMNKKAREIGANDTSFVNPNGLDAPNHFTTARDLAKIACDAMQNSDFAEIVATKEILKHPMDSDEDLWFINHNKLLKKYDGCIGVKTGYTKSAGRCLVSAAARNGMSFIAVTLKDVNDWDDHAEMLDYAFGKYSPKEIVLKGQTIKTVSADDGRHVFIASESFSIPFRENEIQDVEVVTHMMENPYAPVNAGEKVGYMEIIYEGKKVGNVDIISESDILGTNKFKVKNSLKNAVMSVLRIWCI